MVQSLVAIQAVARTEQLAANDLAKANNAKVSDTNPAGWLVQTRYIRCPYWLISTCGHRLIMIDDTFR